MQKNIEGGDVYQGEEAEKLWLLKLKLAIRSAK